MSSRRAAEEQRTAWSSLLLRISTAMPNPQKQQVTSNEAMDRYGAGNEREQLVVCRLPLVRADPLAGGGRGELGEAVEQPARVGFGDHQRAVRFGDEALDGGVVEQGQELAELPEGMSGKEAGAGMEPVGQVYRDPKTGKLILVGQ